MLQSGDVFEGKYVIRETLGQGGFAVVFRAHQSNIKRDVAIKLVHPAKTLGVHPERLFQRFHREAQLLAEMQTEQNVRLIDFGHSKELDSLFMVMEYVDGAPLDKLIKRNGPLAPERVVVIVEQILLALEEAHKLQILHRDVKPGNIIIFDRLGQTDRAKLIDYGIAKPMKPDVEGGGITQEGSIVGTPRYMAPEQIILVNALGPATDIYSLGLVAYEMLCGRPLLFEKSQTEVLKRQLSNEVFYLPQDIPAPADLAAVINMMLVKSPRDRYQSAAEVLTALRKCNVAGAPAASISGAFANNYGPSPGTAETQIERPNTGEQSHDQSGMGAGYHPHAQRDQYPQYQSGPHTPYPQQPPPQLQHSPQYAQQGNPQIYGHPNAQYPYEGSPYPNATPIPEGRNPVQNPYGQQGPVHPPGYQPQPQHPQHPHQHQHPQAPVSNTGSFMGPAPDAATKSKSMMIGIAVSAVVVLGFLIMVAPTGLFSRVLGQASCVEDQYEPNQRSLDGTVLTRGARIPATVCPGDVDWYFVGNREPGDVVAVSTENGEGDANVTLEMYVDSRFIKRASNSQSGGIVSHRLEKRGAVSVRVSLGSSQGNAGRDYVVSLNTDSRARGR